MPAAGTLIAIGGSEDWKGERTVLRELVARVGDGRLVVCTSASTEPGDRWEEYDDVLRGMGLADIAHLDLRSREEAFALGALTALDGAAAIFFTGGDQTRLMATLGASPVAERLRQMHAAGLMIAGTSAGAALLGEVMLTGGSGHRSARLHELPPIAPALSLVPGVILEHHFAERARFGRLVGALAQRPELLGVGIDEDTAVIIAGDQESFQVVGQGAVYVFDVVDTRHANRAPDRRGTLAMFGTCLEVLAAGDVYDMAEREVISAAQPA